MYTISNNENEHAEGIYNKSNSGATNDLKTQHSVGMGSGEEDRKNSFEIMKNGDAYLTGVGSYDGTNIETAKTLQEVINELSNSPVINEDYEFDTELNSFRIGREVTPEEIEDL
jgi:hypothetical protein